MIEVLTSGVFDTIQDKGRFGVQNFGVPYSGVMDSYASNLANSILGNTQEAALIESTFTGPKLKFHINTMISITGAQMQPALNGIAIKNNTAISVNSNDILSFGKLQYGLRMYIAVLGGFQTEEKLFSRSMYTNITSKFRLQRGDMLPIHSSDARRSITFSAIKIDRDHFHNPQIDVLKGPEFDKLSPLQQEALYDIELTVSNESNRMAYQFYERFNNDLAPIITSLVLPGTVQLTPSGQLIVLMKDCQTTGGYPRIFQLTSASLNRLSQKIFGDKIRLKCKK
ncbi:biotin-dependent carboxyltransferase family protein [Psychroserpens algicola]|uniref:Biotin-dependent carboxyltransferase family protein n=1 Tax=Psychroserpens algicola TaxID=1719034 RepID=A0ABT0HAK8_9FLAO|nr:biotin-dependent carboxyltransferase family protein [Psychroserpens algicola]MCK8481212.1 biotin-dependent carboxyltransferase family protein [Psychroserpens algicola]